MNLDELIQGSKFHQARALSDGIFALTVADPGDDGCLREFQAIVADAERQGHRVTNKHRYTQRGLPGWMRDYSVCSGYGTRHMEAAAGSGVAS